MKKFVLLCCLFQWALITQAQTTIQSPNRKTEKKQARKDMINELIRLDEEGEIIFNKQNTFAIRLNTDGYGVRYEYAHFKTNRRALVFQFDLSEKKHPKENKLTFSDGSYNYTTLIYGKMNNVYQVNLGFGQQHILGGKGNKNGVAVMGVYSGGATIGLEKPYLVNVIDVSSGYRYRDRYPNIIEKGAQELGTAGFGAGWGQLNVNPGIFLQTALRFDYGRYNEAVGAIEVGLKGEYFSQKVEQMAYVDPKNFFFSGYIALVFGKRK